MDRTKAADTPCWNSEELGYDHVLSKRTDIYAMYSYDKLSAHPTGNTFAVGVRHTF